MLAYLHYPGAADARAAGLYAAEVPRGTSVRAYLAARRTARELSERGVRGAVFPGEYAYAEVFARRGIRPVEAFALRCALCAELTLSALSALHIPPQRARVCFAARYASGEVAAAVLRAAERVRYSALRMDGAQALADALRRSLGVAPCAAETADLWVCFDETAAARSALPLWDETFEITYAMDGAPIGEPLLAALHRTGAAGEIAVLSASPVREG